MEVLDMPRIRRAVSDTGIYHVMLRGINQQRIFEDENDYQFFLAKLAFIKEESPFYLFSYCLLSNHIHLLIQEKECSLAYLFKRLETSYAYYFNKKYTRTGHLFQDRFKSEPIEEDTYLLAVIGYIHQNPVRAGICCDAVKYRWSSLFKLGRKGSLVDEDRLYMLVPEKDVRLLSERDPEIEPFREASPGRKPKFSEEEAVLLMESLSGVQSTSQFQKLSKEQQKETVVSLRNHGVSIRQTARICGLSKGLIESWLRAAT